MADDEEFEISDTVSEMDARSSIPSASNPLMRRKLSSTTFKATMKDIVNTVKKVNSSEYQHDVDKLILFNVTPSPRDDRDWNSEAIFDASSKLPGSLDLRKKLNLPRDQSNQGTSAAQVAACMKEWHERKHSDFKDYMSPQFVYNNRTNQNTVGMYGRDVMRILLKAGVCPETSYPYEKVEAKTEIDKKFYYEAKNFRIKGYARVNTVESLKRALYTNGPCYISFPVYNHTTRLWKQQKNCFDVGEKRMGGHAMTVVGYNKRGFIIRNSWGMFWDDKGYCTYPYTDWGCHYEIWTMIDDSSYQPVNKSGLFTFSKKKKEKKEDKYRSGPKAVVHDKRDKKEYNKFVDETNELDDIEEEEEDGQED
jgi:hypothetical protein